MGTTAPAGGSGGVRGRSAESPLLAPGRGGAAQGEERASGWGAASTWALRPKPPITWTGRQETTKAVRVLCLPPARDASERASRTQSGTMSCVCLEERARRRRGREGAASGPAHVGPVREFEALHEREHGPAVLARHLAGRQGLSGEQAEPGPRDEALPHLHFGPVIEGSEGVPARRRRGGVLPCGRCSLRHLTGGFDVLCGVCVRWRAEGGVSQQFPFRSSPSGSACGHAVNASDGRSGGMNDVLFCLSSAVAQQSCVLVGPDKHHLTSTHLQLSHSSCPRSCWCHVADAALVHGGWGKTFHSAPKY